MEEFYKSVLDQDHMPVVLCDLNHKVVYMNESSIKKYGGNLVGSNLLDCHDEKSKERILIVLEWFNKSVGNNIIHTFYNEDDNRDVYMIALRNSKKELIGYYERHIERNPDKTKLYDMK